MTATQEDTDQEETVNVTMAIYEEAKERFDDMLILFRMGDFYEAYSEDAYVIGKDVGLTITTRDEVPKVGFPYHSLETHLRTLLQKGHRIAIAEQVDGEIGGYAPHVNRKVEHVDDLIPHTNQRDEEEIEEEAEEEETVPEVKEPPPLLVPDTGIAQYLMRGWRSWGATEWRRFAKGFGGEIEQSIKGVAKTIARFNDPIALLNTGELNTKYSMQALAGHTGWCTNCKVVFQLSPDEKRRAKLYWAGLDDRYPPVDAILGTRGNVVRPTAVVRQEQGEVLMVRLECDEWWCFVDAGYLAVLHQRMPMDYQLVQAGGEGKCVWAVDYVGGECLGAIMPLSGHESFKGDWLWIEE